MSTATLELSSITPNGKCHAWVCTIEGFDATGKYKWGPFLESENGIPNYDETWDEYPIFTLKSGNLYFVHSPNLKGFERYYATVVDGKVCRLTPTAARKTAADKWQPATSRTVTVEDY